MLIEAQKFTSSRSRPASRRAILLFAILGIALALRLLHLSSEMLSPLSYQPGPDEAYYRQFGEAVAAARGQDGPEFTFMDPGYGYILGGIFAVFGTNAFVVYLLQVLLDTATAYGIYVAGRLLGRPRAGLFGAAVYGLTSTAIMFSVALLKETWVTAFLTWWLVGCLALLDGRRGWSWLAFGAYCGIGVALRSTLLLTGVLTLFLPLLARRDAAVVLDREPAQRPDGGTGLPSPGPTRWMRAALLACGLIAGLLPMALRNHAATGSFSPLPSNGGIVLHQLYNEHNPRSAMWIPRFVNYYDPEEIRRGYAAEASRRENRPLTPAEVDHYWRKAALNYIAHDPTLALRAMLRKAGAFLAATEIPSNRSSAEERLFSPVLRVLPAPAPWLLAMGLVGLLVLGLKDRRWIIAAAPIGLAWLTYTFFWAEDRFRLHAMSALALCSGCFIERALNLLREPRRLRLLALVTGALGVGAASLLLGVLMPAPPLRWDHVIWGYIRMGKLSLAQALAADVVRDQPNNEPALEALGVTAAIARRYPEAERYLRRALALRPGSHVAHYNLARVYLAEGNRRAAEHEARAAFALEPAPEYRALLVKIENEP